jgi:hypothetical protein
LRRRDEDTVTPEKFAGPKKLLISTAEAGGNVEGRRR